MAPVASEAGGGVMTLGDFLSTRRWSDDLTPHIGYGPEERTPKGYLYLGCLYIEQTDLALGQRWRLTIGNTERLTDDLPALERELYEWAKAEGYEV